jgi:hypothetical protein
LGRKLGIHRYLVDLPISRNVESVVDDHEFAYGDLRTAWKIDRSAQVFVVISPTVLFSSGNQVCSRNEHAEDQKEEIPDPQQ